MAIVYKLKNELHKALNCYQTALERAIAAGDHESSMIYLYKFTELNDKSNRKDEAVNFATEAYQLATSHRNLGYAVNVSKLLNRFFAETCNINKASFYLNKVVNYSDSLKQQETSEKSQTAKILLITTQVKDSVRYFQVAEHHKIQKTQSFLIVLLSFSLLIFLFSYVYHRK